MRKYLKQYKKLMTKVIEPVQYSCFASVSKALKVDFCLMVCYSSSSYSLGHTINHLSDKVRVLPWIITNCAHLRLDKKRSDKLRHHGGRHSTEVASALLTQPTRVPEVFSSMLLRLIDSAA